MAAPNPPQSSVPGRYDKRKSPRQQRSRLTVESIKQATLELAAADGFSALSTGAIAERAGISIGSLYQYYPNREAILLALYEDTSATVAEAMKSVLIEILDKPIETGVRRVVARLLELNRAHQLVLLQLATEMPELKLSNHPVSFENLSRGSVRIYLNQRISHLRPLDMERKLFFIEQMINGCVRGYLTNPPPRVSTNAFVTDLARVVTAYINQ